MNAVPCPTPKACEARAERVFAQTPTSACGALKGNSGVCAAHTMCCQSSVLSPVLLAARQLPLCARHKMARQVHSHPMTA